MKTIEAYVRYSDHNQDDGYSVEYQCTEIKEYCTRHGLTLHQTHIDQAQTATKVAGREAFFTLIERVKAGTVQTIIVYKMNRMFRNSYESHKYRKLFRAHNVRIISVTEMIDENSSSGRLMTNVLADIDQYQSETTSDHVKSSMREMARQGHYTGGPVAYGFALEEVENGTKVRKKFVHDEKESEIVREIFGLYADGKTLSFIQDTLREKGIKKRSGSEFSLQDLSRMLKKESYIGTHRFKTQGYDELIIEDCYDAIVDLDVWRKVQARKNSDKLLTPRKQKERIYGLTGIIICSSCGDHYTGYCSGRSKRRKGDIARYYYACRNKQSLRNCKAANIRKEEAEKAVMNAIKANILNDQSIIEISAQVAAMCKENPKEITAKIKKLKSEITRLEKRISDLVDMKLDGKISAEMLDQKNKLAEDDLLAVRVQLLSLEEQKKNSVSVESIADYLKSMLAKCDDKDGEVLRSVFETFVERVIIDDSEIKVFLKVYPFEFVAYNGSDSPPSVTLSAEIKR